MDFGGWEQNKTDGLRLKRLAAGSVVGSIVVLSTLAVVAATAAKAYGLDHDDTIVEAAIVDSPEEEQKVDVAPEPAATDAPKPKPSANLLVQPTEVDDKLVEKTPVATDNPYAGVDPYAMLDSAARAPEPEKVKVEAAPTLVQKPKPVVQQHAAASGPVAVTEDVTPPRAISNTPPSYPADAKAAGIEGTVVIKYVVTETGAVTGVTAVRGPPELVAVCEAAVRSWRFMPAQKDGQSVAVTRVARFPFRIKT
ncbi:MAG: energy transducer TonB [Myxococcales bacterium]|nr:energy transducer TonB [Myxococcales bacterium]